VNHLLNIIKFYKLFKNNYLEAITTYILRFNIFKPSKIIKTNDFYILYFDNLYITTDCAFCFKNVYNFNESSYIPIEINDSHFFLIPSINQIFNNHLLINDFIHKESTNKNQINNMQKILELFPSLMTFYHESNHNHFELGEINSPLFNKDATFFKDEIYKVEWFLPTFLIKDKDINILNINLNILNNTYKNYKQILILFKRFDKYYLYIIYQTNNMLNVYESIGLFTSNNIISLNKEIANIKIKMDA
jgi:hypothetical protein